MKKRVMHRETAYLLAMMILSLGTALMERADIDIAGDSALDEMSVDKRIERLRNDPDAKDPALAALYARFGRYLLISSSRPGRGAEMLTSRLRNISPSATRT